MNVCPICGYNNLHRPPHDPDGYGSDEICPCRRFQFGLSDYPYEKKELLIVAWRKKWISNGCKWFSKSRTTPKDWNASAQLEELLNQQK